MRPNILALKQIKDYDKSQSLYNTKWIQITTMTHIFKKLRNLYLVSDTFKTTVLGAKIWQIQNIFLPRQSLHKNINMTNIFQ